MRILIEYETVSVSDLGYPYERKLADVPVDYYNALKIDIQAHGLLRPIKVHAFVRKTSDNLFSITERILQDGFVRLEIYKELGLKDIECETHFFVSDKGLTIGYKPQKLNIKDIRYSGDKTQYIEIELFPTLANWESIGNQTYSEAKASHNLAQKEFQDLIASIKEKGQLRLVECYCRVTENEDGHWLYSGVTSQDDQFLCACEEAGLSNINCNVRLIDYREGRR